MLRNASARVAHLAPQAADRRRRTEAADAFLGSLAAPTVSGEAAGSAAATIVEAASKLAALTSSALAAKSEFAALQRQALCAKQRCAATQAALSRARRGSETMLQFAAGPALETRALGSLTRGARPTHPSCAVRVYAHTALRPRARPNHHLPCNQSGERSPFHDVGRLPVIVQNGRWMAMRGQAPLWLAVCSDAFQRHNITLLARYRACADLKRLRAAIQQAEAQEALVRRQDADARAQVDTTRAENARLMASITSREATHRQQEQILASVHQAVRDKACPCLTCAAPAS